MLQVLVVAAVLLVIGVAVCRWLRTGRYRRPGESGPLPRHLWVVPVAPFAGVLVGHSLAEHPWPVLLPYLVLVPAGLALAAIDADVHRLPNAITLPLVPVEVVLLAGASAASGDWGALRRAALAALVVGGVLLTLSLVAHGRSIGMGDAKLVVPLAAALGWLSWGQVLAGLWFGFVLGGVVALGLLLTRRANRGTHLAFGPYLVSGTLLALLVG